MRTKPCTRCFEDIYLDKDSTGAWKPFNVTGSRHYCTASADVLPPPLMRTEAVVTNELPPEFEAALILINSVKDRLKYLDRLREIPTKDELIGSLHEFIDEQIQVRVAKLAPIQVNVLQPNGELTHVNVGRQHKSFPELFRFVVIRKHVFIVGPSGSGKTTTGQAVTEAANLRFFPLSMGPGVTDTRLAGYTDAVGNYVPGIMFDPFVNGGVFMADEMDSANSKALIPMNSALSNEYCSFPNGVQKRHRDFVCIASGNTYGRGADRQYVGRTQQDAAVLDRFAFLDWDYDEDLEQAMVAGKVEASGNDSLFQWLDYVWALRKAAERTGVRIVVSTRAILDGCDYLIGGFSFEQTANARFWTYTSKDDRAKLETQLDKGPSKSWYDIKRESANS